MNHSAEGVSGPRLRTDALWLALLAAAYFLAHELAFLLPDAQKVVAAIWPAGGIGLAALLLSPRRRWPAILLVLFLAGNAANLLVGRHLPASLGFMTANVIESLACAWLITRWCGDSIRFSRVKDVEALFLCATVVNGCTSLLGAGTAALTSASPFWDAWLTWWVTDGLGILLVAPLIVAWSDAGNWFAALRWGRILESAIFLAVWCAAGWWTLQPAAHFHALSPQPYMLVGLLAWAALRLGQREVTLALALLAVIAVTSKAVSAGPLLWGGADPLERLLAVQVYMAFAAATGMLLAASYAERQAAEQSSRENHARLRALGDNLPNGMVYQVAGDLDGNRRFLYVSSGIEELMGVTPEEVLGDSSAFYGVFMEEDRPAFTAAQRTSARDMSVFDIEVRMRRRDGEVRWVHLCSTPRRLPDGRILWDGILMDITDRKREEAARQESEVRFRLVVENAELPVAITSMEDRKVLFLNESAARYFDVPQAEALGLYAPDFWRDPAAREQFARTLSETGRVAGLEVNIQTRAGQCKWASVSANVIKYGGQQAAFVVFHDVTAIKEATAKLERERGVLSAIFQTAPDMIWMKDAEGRYVTCNAATERFFGLPESAIIGRADHEIFPRESADVIVAEDRAAIAAGVPLLAHAWVPVGDDSRRILLETNKTPMLDGEGRLAGILCVARDVTAAHQAQEALRERVALQEQLAEAGVRRRILFEQSKDGIAVVDLNGKLQEANQAFADLLGCTQAEMCSLHIWDWDAQWTREELLRKLVDLSLAPATFETRHRRKDGSFQEVEVSAGVVEFGGQKLVHSTHRDITSRKAAEAALRESRRLEGIGILAGGMAHEFNNLLTVINGYSGLLSRGFDIHDPVREQIDAIRAAGEGAANLTQQLLAFGRKQLIRPRVLDLNMVVERSRQAWMPLLRPNIGLRMELATSPRLVSVDADRMRDVLVNLVKNAVEALPNGGELAIGTATVQIDEEYATQHADAHPGWYVMLSVADTGVGMNEQTRARVFDPFFTTRDRATTTGLGLATVHGSVAQHHGWITADSAPGKGAAFKIYLPRVAERDGPDPGAVTLTGNPDSGTTVLVVEQDDAVRRLTLSILRGQGYRTLEAANGPQAMALAEGYREPVHLILTDVLLPGMTGRELVEQWKARIPAPKVLYVSGYPEDVIASYSGDDPFIQKPYAPDLLLAKVAEILDHGEGDTPTAD